jgi:hypothetical protein
MHKKGDTVLAWYVLFDARLNVAWISGEYWFWWVASIGEEAFFAEASA